jgi:hypothetical protein
LCRSVGSALERVCLHSPCVVVLLPSLARCCRAAAFTRFVLSCCCLHSPRVVVLLRPVLSCCCLHLTCNLLNTLDACPSACLLPSQAGTNTTRVTFGYAVQRQARPWECAPGFAMQRVLCEAPSPAHFSFDGWGAPLVTPFDDVVRKAATLGNGAWVGCAALCSSSVQTLLRVHGSCLSCLPPCLGLRGCRHDCGHLRLRGGRGTVVPRAGGEGAGQRVVPYRHTSAVSVPDVGWCTCMFPQGLPSGVVVSMDWGAYKYLVNRGVPTVLVTTKQHLDVCCLRRFRMVPWRSTNDVKVRANSAGAAVPFPMP